MLLVNNRISLMKRLKYYILKSNANTLILLLSFYEIIQIQVQIYDWYTQILTINN